MIVAVSQRVDQVPGRNERRDALDQRFGAWLLAGGLWPVPVPNALGGTPGSVEAWLRAVHAAGVVLSGGNDLGESPERDETERRLIAWAQARSAPLLGVCRGMQMLGVCAGAQLVPVRNHAGTRHSLTGLPGEVNSFHNFALAECPPGYSVVARAMDGGLEAVRHDSLPWEGWMWHPEREQEFTPADIARLQAVFAKTVTQERP
ncbi:MAG: gamma-glutamyl-gamma-aminobutyrate hydrolase family protein [Deltaproteobacteria bacterium]|nr:gamma-glutamyl-gamma-aminobutyrate hydrolase family protein [Deltaproteobacteria bacterium]